MNFISRISGVSLYRALLTCALAAAWLLPNHSPPWSTFHASAWTAAAMLMIGLWFLGRAAAPIRVSRQTVFLCILAAVPWLQHIVGLVPLNSAALLSSLYLAGLAASFALGEHAQRCIPGDVVKMILVSATVASVISVLIQIHQWLGFAQAMELQEIWVFPSNGSRPYANLGQPNQLASLLLWGVLGVGCLWAQKHIRARLAIALAAFILMGVALTESRTAMLTLTIGVILVTFWRVPFIDRGTRRAAQGLYAIYVGCLFAMEPLGRLMGLEHSLSVFQRSAGEIRLALWRMALDASRERPWFGFGWNETNEGLLLVFPRHPTFANVYAEQSHNLVLDLVLWVGWPLTIVLLGAIAWWFYRVLRSISDVVQLLGAAALVVMLVHAMLELPLHHGYFLWPFGVLAGAASARLPMSRMRSISRAAGSTVLVTLGLFVGLIVHDYLNIEASFTELRLQLARIGRNHDERPPSTYLLTDWTDFIAMTRATPSGGMSDAQIQRWQDLLVYNTSPLAFQKLIGALALNGREAQARYWDERTCFVLHDSLCEKFLQRWTPAAKQPLSAPAAQQGV